MTAARSCAGPSSSGGIGFTCSPLTNGFDACHSCPDAPGAKVANTRGIGERCAQGGDCASGLACEHGMCTRACSADADCHARADQCDLLYQFPNTCATIGGVQRCTTACAFGDDSKCQYDFGHAATCTNHQCIPQ